MAEKVLVTGAAGLVGGNLVRRLVGQGFEVGALLIPGSNTAAFDDLPVHKLSGDVLDPQSMDQATKGADYVFHLAAMVTMWRYNAGRVRDVNVTGTINVIEACMKNNIKRLMHVSTVDAIGFSTPDGHGFIDKPSTEDVPYQNDRFNIPYMKTKWEAQQIVRTAVRNKKIDAVILNPTYMLGPYDVRPSSGRMILEIVRSKVVPYTTGGNNFVHVGDVADAMVNALKKGRTGELYILGNENLFYRQIFEKIASVTGKNPTFVKVPKLLALAGGYLGDIYGILKDVEPKISSGEATMGFVQHFFSPEKARKELGLKSTPVETAIEDAFRWFVDNGYTGKA